MNEIDKKKKEMNMANVKNVAFGTQHNLYSTDLRWGNANFKIHAGGNTNFSIFRYRHVGIPNTKCFCISVEYRLKL